MVEGRGPRGLEPAMNRRLGGLAIDVASIVTVAEMLI